MRLHASFISVTHLPWFICSIAFILPPQSFVICRQPDAADEGAFCSANTTVVRGPKRAATEDG